jgi:hypothetical protein
MKHLWSHPAAGIAVDARAIDIKIATHVLRTTLTQLRHSCTSRGNTSTLHTAIAFVVFYDSCQQIAT